MGTGRQGDGGEGEVRSGGLEVLVVGDVHGRVLSRKRTLSLHPAQGGNVLPEMQVTWWAPPAAVRRAPHWRAGSERLPPHGGAGGPRWRRSGVGSCHTSPADLRRGDRARGRDGRIGLGRGAFDGVEARIAPACANPHAAARRGRWSCGCLWLRDAQYLPRPS